MTEELQYKLDGQPIKKCTISIKADNGWGTKATLTGSQAQEAVESMVEIIERNMRQRWGKE